MKYILDFIIFYLTMPIWIATFFIYYGVRVGIYLAEELLNVSLLKWK